MANQRQVEEIHGRLEAENQQVTIRLSGSIRVASAELSHTHHSALVGVLVAAGVVGPGAVALRVQEPAAALGADLGDHLCRSRRCRVRPKNGAPKRGEGVLPEGSKSWK